MATSIEGASVNVASEAITGRIFISSPLEILFILALTIVFQEGYEL